MMLKGVIGTVTGTSAKTLDSIKKLFRPMGGLHRSEDHDTDQTLPFLPQPRYKLVDHIAHGGCSEVFLARKHRRFIPLSRYNYAVKICRVKEENVRAPGEAFSTPGDEIESDDEDVHGDGLVTASGAADDEDFFVGSRESVMQELNVLKRLNSGRNGHVVKLYDFFETADSVADATKIWLVMECLSTSLAFVHRCNLEPDSNHMTERTIFAVVRGVARALTYLHECRVLHVDVKPGNVLLSNTGNVKLCDFGISKVLPEQEETLVVTSVQGTPQYMAPELTRVGEGFDRSVDVWPLGIILYILHEKKDLTFGRYVLGGQYLSRQEYLSLAEPTQHQQYTREYDALTESHVHHAGYASLVRKCLVPYPRRGPEGMITRDDLSERATLEDVTKWCDQHIRETPELFLRQAIMRCVEYTLREIDAIESDSTGPSLTL